MSDFNGSRAWFDEAEALLERIVTSQADVLEQTAQLCAESSATEGLVHLFGTGHSRMPVEEMFPRYGSFPGFHPIVELSMSNHFDVVGTNGQRQAMFIERVEGLGEVILDNFSYRPTDAFMVFSASGRSAVPLEVARGARERGLAVIAVTSIVESMARPATHPSGTRLLDHADVVIDVGTPPGDAMVPVPGLDTPVGPGSTLAYAAIVNEIKAQTAELLVEREAMPSVITAASVVGEERSRELFEDAYDDHARRMSRAIDPGAPT